MGKIDFLFAIHNHQPVGNFGWVFESAYERCYLPYIEHLERFGDFRSSLHFSGPLLEWIEENRPKLFPRIRKLVQNGQVEILGGGMYEPILSTLTPEDAIGQIREMTRYVKEHFDADVRGIWLTERIWEPTLPSLLCEAGIEFTIIDETHFRYAGIPADKMFGYYVTEDRGRTLAVFPIDMELRYRIPFHDSSEVIGYLGEIAEMGEGKISTYGDDGEKFGVWPDTHEWVYGGKWLETFLDGICANRGWVRMRHFSEILDSRTPTGRVYLPTASYEEMMEWALPAHAGAELEEITHELKEQKEYERFHPFLRGGFWPNFFAKYSESNRMHKKMLDVSRTVKLAFGDSEKNLQPAYRELYRSQCNCAYWHGMFGGLYLNYLRHALFQCMIRAEIMAEKKLAGDGNPRPLVEKRDLDCDGNEEIIVSGKKLSMVIHPSYGGGLSLLAVRDYDFMLSNTLGRRLEAYHKKIRESVAVTEDDSAADDDSPKSIHDLAQSKEEGLERYLIHDKFDRYCFQDHFLSSRSDLNSFRQCRCKEQGDFIDHPYALDACKTKEHKASIRLYRDGSLRIDYAKYPIRLEKEYSIRTDDGEIEVKYKIINRSKKKIRFRFGVEQNLTLLAGQADDRFYLVDGKKPVDPSMVSIREVKEAAKVSMVDAFYGFETRLSSKKPFRFWRYPVETVSQSEGGFERTYQGSCLLCSWDVNLDGLGTEKFALKLAVKEWK